MATVQRYVDTGSSGGDGTTDATSGATAAYASASSWEANQTGHAATDDIFVDCAATDTGSGNLPDTAALNIDFATNLTTGSVTIRGNRSKATGFYDGDALISTAHYRLSRAGKGITNNEPNVTIDGIQIEDTGTGSFEACVEIRTWNGLTVRKNHLRSSARGCISTTGTSTSAGNNGTCLFENNVMSGGFATGAIDCDVATHITITVNIYNNTIYCSGSVPGIRSVNGGGVATQTINIKNNAIGNTTVPFVKGANFTHNYDTNATDNGTAGTTNEVDLTPGAGTLSDVWTSPGTAQASDFTVKGTSSPIYNTGISSGMPTDDIQDNTRSGTWDIGAFELQVGGGDTTVTLDKYTLAWSGKTGFGAVATPVAKYSMSWSGKTFLGSVSVPTTKYTLTWSGKNFTVDAGNSVAMGKYSLVWSGKTAFGALSAPVTKYTIAWSGKTSKADVSVPVAKYTLSWVGKTFSVLANLSVIISKYALTWTGKTTQAGIGITQYCRSMVRSFTRDFGKLFKRDFSC